MKPRPLTATAADRAFAFLQELLPQQLLCDQQGSDRVLLVGDLLACLRVRDGNAVAANFHS